MIIEQITLSNWLSYPAKWQQNGKLIEPTLRFDQEQAYLIYGKNGAGKSSIMEAILFALFGHYSRATERQDIKREGAIRTGEKTAVIELIFKLNGKRYKVKRVLTESTTKAEHSSWDAKGQKWVLETAQVTTVNAKISDLLGLNQDLFCGTVILEQGKTGRFMELKPGDQVDHVKNLLGLNIYSLYYEKAKELANQRKSELRRIEGELKGLTDVSKETVENAEKETKRLEKSLEKIDVNVRYLDQLNTKVLIVERIRSELSDITQKINGFESQLTQKEEIERAAQIVSDWEEIQQIIKGIREVQRQLSEQQNRIDNLQDELTVKENARLDNQNNLDKKYKPDHQEIEATLEKIKEALKTKRTKLAVSKNQRDLIEAELDLDHRQSEVQAEQKERQQQLEEVAQVEAKHSLLNELNEVVPKLEAVVFTLIRSYEEIITVGKSEQALERELKELEKRRTKFAELKEQSEALDDHLHAAEELEENIRRQQEADEDLLNKREEAHGKSLCPTCGTLLEGKELDRFHHELIDLRKKVKSGKSLLKETRQNTVQIKKQAEEDKKKCKQHEKEISREESRLSSEQEILTSQNDQAKKQEKDALKKWELLKRKLNYSAQFISDPTKSCLEIAQKKQKELKDIQKRYTQLMRTQAEFNTAQTELENILGQRQFPMGTYSQVQLKEANVTVSELEDTIEGDEQTLEIKKGEERILYHLLTKTESEINGLSGRIQDIEKKLIPKEKEIYIDIKCRQEEILGRVEKRLDKLDWPAKQLKDLRRSIDKDQKAEQRLNDWIESHGPLSNQLSELGAAEKEIGGLRFRYTTLDEQIKGFPEDVQHGKSKTIEKNLDAKRKELDERKAEHEHWKKTVWEETKRLSQKLSGEEQLIRLSKEERSFRELALLLEPPGPRSAGGPLLQEIMRDALKKVAKKASDILDEWNQSTQIVIPQDALGFRVVDLTSGSTERHFQLFSGGEKFMVALAMALAIGEVASDTGHTDCLFIDEGFGLLDKENRAYVTQEIVSKLVSSGRRKQVIVVTHMEDIKDAFPDRRSRYHLVNNGSATQLVVGDDDDSS